MDDNKLNLVVGVLTIIVFVGVNLFIDDIPSFDGTVILPSMLIASLIVLIISLIGRTFKISLVCLGISLVLILPLLPNIRDIPVCFRKNYSTAYVKVEKYYYHGERGGIRKNEYIVCTVIGSAQKVTFRLPSQSYPDTKDLSELCDEMEGNEYKVTYLPNTKQIINLKEKKQAVPDKSTSENE